MKKIFRKIKKCFSISEWRVRLCRLPQDKEISRKKGLIMVQIDGLSRTQIELALASGRMPFLKKLLKKERYQLHSLYSGLPSTTPSVQGELFYGVKTIVPAFSFKSHDTGKILCMYEANSARFIEEKLKDHDSEALLKNGSCYCNIYTGGSSEAFFCPTSIGWKTLLSNRYSVRSLLSLLFHIYTFLRVLILLVLEFFIACIDFVCGIIAKKDFFQEVKFVPARVAVCVLLRELITIGAKFDITRGLPIIHLNLIGYDEQAHRRGPKSKIAHWTLKGIDAAISDIWGHACKTHHLKYDIWIYSDHGQETTIPYSQLYGHNIAEAVNKSLFQTAKSKTQTLEKPIDMSIGTVRVKLFDEKKLQEFFSKICQILPIHFNGNQSDGAEVVAMGPVGFIYLHQPLETDKQDIFAQRLVTNASIPNVIVKENDILYFHCNEGKFTLEDHADKLLGQHHPFLQDAAHDLATMCQHPDAGDLIILGWHHTRTCITFPIQNGSHAGPGSEETHAFALLPMDTPLPSISPHPQNTSSNSNSYLRISDIRHAVLTQLGRKPQGK